MIYICAIQDAPNSNEPMSWSSRVKLGAGKPPAAPAPAQPAAQPGIMEFLTMSWSSRVKLGAGKPPPVQSQSAAQPGNGAVASSKKWSILVMEQSRQVSNRAVASRK